MNRKEEEDTVDQKVDGIFRGLVGDLASDA
jgi:hypothetical protein